MLSYSWVEHVGTQIEYYSMKKYLAFIIHPTSLDYSQKLLSLDNVLMDFKKEDQIVGISIEQSFLMSFVPLEFLFQISSNGAHVLLRTFAPNTARKKTFSLPAKFSIFNVCRQQIKFFRVQKTIQVNEIFLYAQGTVSYRGT